MSVYKFFDTDDSGWEEYDISGDEYIQLFKTCFRYCTSFSMYVNSNINSPKLPAGIEEHRIPVEEYVVRAYTHYGASQNQNENQKEKFEIRHYILSPEVQKALVSFADSIFKWVYGWGHANPSDPAFFRSDGSIFFNSVIHEGECTIYPRDDEDISEILSNDKWVLVT